MEKYLSRVNDEQLGNLLAIIHRDGGHNRKEEGTLESVRQAIEKVHAERRQIDELSYRLKRIASIIEAVDDRCLAADGPVTPTLQEMRQEEMTEIYEHASGKKPKAVGPLKGDD